MGVIEAEIATEVKEFSGLGVGGGVILTWDLYEHPILRGQNIYRRESGKVYPGEPYTRLGMTDSYLDLQVKAGQEYYYKACSYDLGGNQHECSLEHAVIAQGSDPIFLPFATKR